MFGRLTLRYAGAPSSQLWTGRSATPPFCDSKYGATDPGGVAP